MNFQIVTMRRKKKYLIGLGYQKIHACPNDFMLYINDFEELDVYPIWEASCYKVKEMNGGDDLITKRPPKKVLWYLLIIMRFKRLFSNEFKAKNMRWNANKRKIDGVFQ